MSHSYCVWLDLFYVPERFCFYGFGIAYNAIHTYIHLFCYNIFGISNAHATVFGTATIDTLFLKIHMTTNSSSQNRVSLVYPHKNVCFLFPILN